MASSGVRVEVRDYSARTFAELQRRVARVVAAFATAVRVAAQGNAPVDTGTLRDNIREQVGDDPLTWIIVSQVYYSIYMEFGTRYVAARPYLVPALASLRSAYLAALRQAVGAR